MKSRYVRLIALVLLLLFSLTACGTPTPAPQPQESESTTTTTTEATTTTTTTTESTTTTTTTEASTTTTTETTTITKPTTTTAEPTTKKTTQSTASKTTEITTTATTTEINPYAPYEDNSLAPTKDKQCLLLNLMGEQVEMVFEKALVHPADYNRLIWVYTGATKKGVPYTCEVVAEQERISKITCEADSDLGKFTEEEGIAAVREFFQLSRVDVSVRVAQSRKQVGENGQMDYNCIGSFGLVLGDDYNKCTGRIQFRNGKPYVSAVTAQTWSGAWIPGYSGDDIPLLIPRWKSK